jgi:hypothetical protein
MRNIVFKDIKIPQVDYDQLLKDYSSFITKQTGIKPIFYTHDYDYTDYPTDVDVDGDDVPRPTMLQDIADDVDEKYGEWGGDNIIVLIHEDNWKSGATATRPGISGTNYSYRYNNYHLQYVRWWKRTGKSVAQELVNTFGTLNHEIDHSLDALIKQELGININPVLGVVDYDKNTTHGQPEAYHAYIRYQENAAKLKVLAPYLVAAYKKRQDRHTEAVRGMQFTIIGLLEKLVYLYKAKLNQKNGNPNS